MGTFNHVPAHGNKKGVGSSAHHHPTSHTVDTKNGVGGLNFSRHDGSAKSINELVCMYYNNFSYNPRYNARGIMERITNHKDIILPVASRKTE